MLVTKILKISILVTNTEGARAVDAMHQKEKTTAYPPTGHMLTTHYAGFLAYQRRVADAGFIASQTSAAPGIRAWVSPLCSRRSSYLTAWRVHLYFDP